MSDDYAFLFEADGVFGLVGHGPVFNGRVLQGSAAPGDIVHLIDSSIEATGTIKFIESERQLLERTSPAYEIGILLHNLPNEAEFDERRRPYIVDETAPPAELSYESQLGISLPTRMAIPAGAVSLPVARAPVASEPDDAEETETPDPPLRRLLRRIFGRTG